MLFVDLINEYVLILRFHIKALFIKPPKEWEIGEKGDIILLPGIGEPWTFMESLGILASKLGYRIHCIPALMYNYRSLVESAKILEDYMKKNNLKNVILIGHSKGGLIIKEFFQMSSLAERITKVITIATPFSGTRIGYLGALSLWEMRPQNFVTSPSLPFFNLYAKNDNHIIPGKNAILPKGKNKQIDIVGHTRILESHQTLNEVKRIIQ